MQQPWERDVAQLRERELELLRAERGLLVPFAAMAHAVFWTALVRTGPETPATALSLVVASTLTLWIVGLQGRIAGVDHN